MSVARFIKASGGTDFVDGFVILALEMNNDLNAIVTGINNFTAADANIVAGANIDPSKIGDFADTAGVYQTAGAPATRGHSDTVTASGFGILTPTLPTTLEGEISVLRYFPKHASAGIVDNTTGLPVASDWYGFVERGVQLPPTGVMWPYFGTTAPAGWIKLDDGSIGNSTSGATTRASYDTRELFRMLWRMFDDTHCPVSTGRGADPDADFNAGKTIRLPLMAGRIPGISGTPNAANTASVISMACSGSASATDIQIGANVKFLTTNIINGYTVAVTSGARSGQSAVVSSYVVGAAAAPGVITVGAGLSGALAGGDTFTLTKTITTRAHGDAVGQNTLIPLGSNDVGTTGADLDAVIGFGSSAAAVPIHESQMGAPTYFLNWICKL